MKTGIQISIGLVAILVVLASCSRSRTKRDYWDNGHLQSEMTYKKGKLEGKATWYYDNGNKEQEVFYHENVLNGTLKRWYKNGNLETESEYENGKLNGKAISYDNQGNKVMEETYVNDTLEGPYFLYYPNGTVKVEGHYAKGFFTGRWVYYNMSGHVIGTGNFEHGTGIQKSWWPNGKPQRVIHYKDNLKHGEERWYDENGKLERVLVFENGVLVK